MSHDARATQSVLGHLPDGRPVDLFTLRSHSGLQATIISHGGGLTTLSAPDAGGVFEDVVLGIDGLVRPAKWPYFGSLIGRYANRIANGRFPLDGHTYTLTTNNGAHQLHGGTVGWDQALWAGETFERPDASGVRLRHTSPDGDQGFPGCVTALVSYTLDDRNALTIDFHATTDRPTVLNVTQHSYFNLAGPRAADILDHVLMLNADRYTPIDATCIPTGQLAPVDGTPFDFRQPTAIGARINDGHEQLANGHGYDHNFVVRRSGPGLALAARVVDPISGRTLDIHTTEPGIQFYSGNFLDGTITGKGGRTCTRRSGLSLEPQHFPDSPNQPGFPSTTLRPGEEYRSRSMYTFGATRPAR